MSGNQLSFEFITLINYFRQIKQIYYKNKSSDFPPEISISLAAASAVPPVAIKSSMIEFFHFFQ